MSKTFTGGLNFITGKCKPLQKSKSVKTITPEKNIQASFIAWRNIFKRRFPLLNSIFAVPNGYWTENKNYAAAMVAQGLTRGVSDIICLAPSNDKRFHALLIEFKSEVGELTPEQLYFHQTFIYKINL